jgi:hypothetical protein
MATEVRYPEWLEQFERTNYPFEDTATMLSVDGRKLPPTVFLDARFNLIDADKQIYLSAVIVEPSRITLWLGDNLNNRIAHSRFNPATSDQLISFRDNFNRAVGVLMVRPGAVSLFRAWGVGTYEFFPESTRLVASTYMVLPVNTVTGFLLDDGTVISGNVVFVGGPGIMLEVGETHIPEPCGSTIPTGKKSIKVHVVGDPLFKRRLCEPQEFFAAPNFIRQLCFSVPGRSGDPNYPDKEPEIVCCGPGDFGDIKITAGQNDSDASIVRVRVTSEGIVFEAVGERI